MARFRRAFKKLGLGEHDKNIDGYIRDLLK